VITFIPVLYSWIIGTKIWFSWTAGTPRNYKGNLEEACLDFLVIANPLDILHSDFLSDTKFNMTIAEWPYIYIYIYIYMNIKVQE